jgi:DDE superfamily endonuclease
LSFFAERQYILGDSAFENTWFIVSAFKKPRGKKLPREQEIFNDAMSKPRVVSEHMIGILKGRFPWLRQIRNIITDDPKDTKKILDYILAASILHNLLLECKIPDEWVDRDDMSSIDDPDRAQSQDDELNIAVPVGSASDERRQQLMHYFNEFHVIS